jgi:hypothetical protein
MAPFHVRPQVGASGDKTRIAFGKQLRCSLKRVRRL